MVEEIKQVGIEAEQILKSDAKNGVINPQKQSLQLIAKLAKNLNKCLMAFINRYK